MAAERRSRNNTIIDCFAEETFEPGMTVSLVARRHGVAPDQLFTWRRLVALGGLAAAGSGEEVVPASDYRTLQNQVRELHRLLGKKTLQAEILKEALEHATGSKNSCGCRRRCRRTIPDEDRQRSSESSRSNLVERLQRRLGGGFGRRTAPCNIRSSLPISNG